MVAPCSHGTTGAVAETRVALRKPFGQPSDYINANYIEVRRHGGAREGGTLNLATCVLQPLRGLKRRYIAAQGPLDETVSHFWHMVWGEGSVVILMVARCFEGRRVRTAHPTAAACLAHPPPRARSRSPSVPSTGRARARR